ncbi:hypothetical protein [Actinophytocola sp.]
MSSSRGFFLRNADLMTRYRPIDHVHRFAKHLVCTPPITRSAQPL